MPMPWACNLKMLSTTPISVAVVSKPQKADQSLATTPAPTTSEPRFSASDEGHLKKLRQLLHVLHRRASVHNAALVREHRVTANQNVLGDGCPKAVHLQHVGDDLLGLPVDIRVHQSHVIVADDAVAKRREALLHLLDLDAVGQRIPQVLQLAVVRDAGHEEAVPVAHGHPTNDARVSNAH